MNEIRNSLVQVVDVLEQDNRGVQLGCYSVALIGFSIAVRKVRPFSKFKRPSDIPNHFIKEHKELCGVVERIEPNGGLLMIRHKPLVSIPGLPDGQLPVKISGIKVSGLGLSWLQSVVAGHEVRFIPVAKAQNFVQSQVFLHETRKNKPIVINVGEALVRVGFGELADKKKPISSDPAYLTYYYRLQAAEHYALRQKLGYKYYIKPVTSLLTSIVRNFNGLLVDTYRYIIRIPKMPIS